LTGLRHKRNTIALAFNSGTLLVIVKQNSKFLRNLLEKSIGTYDEINLTYTPELDLDIYE